MHKVFHYKVVIKQNNSLLDENIFEALISINKLYNCGLLLHMEKTIISFKTSCKYVVINKVSQI